MRVGDKVKLGEIITLQRGYDLPHSQRLDGDVPIISSSGRSGFHNCHMVKGPGVVTGRYGTVGEVFYIDEDFWPLNTSLFVSDLKGNNPRFIYYLLQTLDFKRFSDKTGVPGVNRNDLHNIRVRPISYFEQDSIVEILSDCDAAIENLEQRLLCLRSSMLARIESLIWQNNLPRSEISDVCTLVNEKVSPASMPAQMRCIELENIDADAAGTINGFATPEGLSSQKTKFYRGDVLFGKLRPYLRKFAFAEFDGICSTEIWALRSHTERMLGKYLFYVMSSERVFAVANKSFGSKMPRADWALLSTLPIPIPDLDQQGEVVAALDCLKDEINQTTELKSLYQKQKRGLMQQLLTGKLRVKGAA